MIFSEFIEKVSAADKSNDIYITASNTSANKAVLPELWDDIFQIPEYLDATTVQNGFFWFGPAGTITPFHHDLTNNFMAQVMGRKRILLTPSWDMPLMRNLFHVYCEIDGRATPPAPRASASQPQILECILSPGEILFLPVGCLHFVEALEISATVSFTNFAFDDNDYTSFYKTYQGV
jgi:ribosomal protein L16 Arg81 hydroxylase